MEVNGLQFSAAGRVGGSTGVVSQNIKTNIDSVINGEVTINGANVMPAMRIMVQPNYLRRPTELQTAQRVLVCP